MPKLKIPRESKRYTRFPVEPIKGIVPVAKTPKEAIPAEVKEKLIELINKNHVLPPALQKSRFTMLVEAGYPYDKAISLCNILFENDHATREIRHRGFDANSAKLTMQEIMHDERTSPETRLKAATETLKVLGEYDDPETPKDKTANILADILRDVMKSNTNSRTAPSATTGNPGTTRKIVEQTP